MTKTDNKDAPKYIYFEKFQNFKQNDLKILIPIRYSIFSKRIDIGLKLDVVSVFDEFAKDLGEHGNLVSNFIDNLNVNSVFLRLFIKSKQKEIRNTVYYSFHEFINSDLPSHRRWINLIAINGKLYLEFDIMALMVRHINSELSRPNIKMDKGFRMRNSMDFYNLSKRFGFKFYYGDISNKKDIILVPIKHGEHLTIYIEDGIFIKDVHKYGLSSKKLAILDDTSSKNPAIIKKISMKIFKNR